MQITNQSQLALLWHIKKKSKNIFDKFLSWYLYIEFISYSVYEKWALRITWAWSLKDAYTNSSSNKQIRNKIITKYIASWMDIASAEKQADKAIKAKVEGQLLWAWFYILLSECSQIDLNTKQIAGIYNQEFYNLLIQAKRDAKLYEVIKWSFAQLLVAINNILADENKTLQAGIYNYNMTNIAKKLLNLSKRQFMRQISNRYASEKDRLSPKNIKYTEWIR